MKNILIKLIGVTAIAGLAALIASLLFKVLLIVTFAAGLGMLLRSKFRKRLYNHSRTTEPASRNNRYFLPSAAVQPVNYTANRTKQPAIIPIQ